MRPRFVAQHLVVLKQHVLKRLARPSTTPRRAPPKSAIPSSAAGSITRSRTPMYGREALDVGGARVCATAPAAFHDPSILLTALGDAREQPRHPLDQRLCQRVQPLARLGQPEPEVSALEQHRLQLLLESADVTRHHPMVLPRILRRPCDAPEPRREAKRAQLWEPVPYAITRCRSTTILRASTAIDGLPARRTPPPSLAQRAAQHDPVLGRLVAVGRLAPRRVETCLEPPSAPERRAQPPA